MIKEICEKAAETGDISEISSWLDSNALNEEDAKTLADFMRAAPYKQMIGCFVASQRNVQNMTRLHGFTSAFMVERVMNEAGTEKQLSSTQE